MSLDYLDLFLSFIYLPLLKQNKITNTTVHLYSYFIPRTNQYGINGSFMLKETKQALTVHV